MEDGRLGAAACLERPRLSAYDGPVKGVLGIWVPVWAAVKHLGVGFILREKLGHRLFGAPQKAAQRFVFRQDRARVGGAQLGAHFGGFMGASPVPRVAKPEFGKHRQFRRLGPPVPNGEADQDILRACLCVFDKHIEIAVCIKNSGVMQFKFRFLF